MSEGNGKKQAANASVDAVMSDDQRSAELRFTNIDGKTSIVAMDSTSIDALIVHLDEVRREMEEPIPFDLSFEEPRPLAAFDPSWRIVPDSTQRHATFWVRHPGLGWSGYGFRRYEAGNIAKWLRKVTATADTRDTHSPSATSFGGDQFLLSTEGLGFYYYGKGENRIGPNPFEQVEFDSDRAAGIVAGSIVERRLEQAIRSKLKGDKPDIAQKLFRPSGPLGAFSNKIDLALLMGIISERAYKDLSILKNIRNDFAHNLDLDMFELPSIRDRCKNLTMVDQHVGPVPDVTEQKEAIFSRPSPYMGLPDFEQKLLDPRFRYMITAQLISSALGQGADAADAPLAFV